MDLLQKNRRLECLNVLMDIESMMVMINDVLMERLELLKTGQDEPFWIVW